MRRPVDWIDAFSATAFGGNGCAVVHDAGDVTPETCMAFVRETGLVECTFLGPSENADYHVRYFLAGAEIPFAGHPTIATAASLWDRGLLAEPRVVFDTGAGKIVVDVTLGDVPIFTVTQIAPVFGTQVPSEIVARIGGIDPRAIVAPPQVVSTGLPIVIALLDSKETLRGLRFDADALGALPQEQTPMEPFWVTLGGETSSGDTFSRLLLAPPSPPEDPFTGSATGAMAAYLWAKGLIETPTFTAEQGHWMGRPGAAQVEVLGARDAITGVRVGGPGFVLMRGTVDV